MHSGTGHGAQPGMGQGNTLPIVFCPTPFTANIIDHPLPPNFKLVKSFRDYDGTGDPAYHVREFERVGTCQSLVDPLACKAFSLTLTDAAGQWFNDLPPNSIPNWATFKDKFLRHFTTSKKQFKSEYHMKSVKQGKTEPLRDFITRFNKEALEVRNLAPNMLMYFFTEGLQDGTFKDELTGFPSPTMDDIKARADYFIRIEENSGGGSQSSNPKPDKGKSSDNTQPSSKTKEGRLNRKGPVGAFTSYTPLNTTRAKVYQAIMHTELTSRPPPMQTKQRDRAKRCEYHNDYGHWTNECVSLKDAIERLVQKGRLQEFVKYSYTVPPRQRTRSPPGRANRSPPRRERDRSRPPKRSPSPQKKSEPRHRGEIHVIAGGIRDQGKKRAREPDQGCGQVDPVSQLTLSFSTLDLPKHRPRDDDPMVVTGVIHQFKVHRIFVDQGSSADIMFWGLFDKLGLGSKDLTPHNRGLIGFTGDSVVPKGYVELSCTFGDRNESRTIPVKFLVVDCPSAYNAILGRPTLNALGAVVSTVHLAMKFPGEKGGIVTLRGNQDEARSCYKESLKVVKTPLTGDVNTEKNRKLLLRDHIRDTKSQVQLPEGAILLTDFDPRTDFAYQRPQPEGDVVEIQIGDSPSKIVKVGASLPPDLRARFVSSLLENADLFAWIPADMPGVDPSVCCHRLSIKPGFVPVAQKKRRMGPERAEAIQKQVKDLLDAGFIREIRYADWISNVVMVKKANGKWRMCTDYTDLNKACPKDPYPLPCIDKLVDNSAGYRYLSFMDAYSGYNQIPMLPSDQDKTAFVTDFGVYCYTVMPFGLKNAGATYQRLMNLVFKEQLGRALEVYIDDMIVKTPFDRDPVADLEEVFQQLRKYNMRLNPTKCTFRVEAGKFLGFMLTNRRIEANPDKCQAVLEMQSPRSIKEVQQLTGRIAALSHFLPASARRNLPLFKSLRSKEDFYWNRPCEEALQEIKSLLAQPPILTRPEPGQPLIVYLSVTDEAVSAALIKEEDKTQKPVYFISKALQGSELNYQKLEKLAYALLIASRRLRPYFQCHLIIVRTSQPIRQVLHRPDLAGRMMAWAIELSQYEIAYEPRQAIKAQVLADFVAEMTHPEAPSPRIWTIYVDGSSNEKGGGAGVTIENSEGIVVEYSLKFGFKTSNNQAEYEACIAGIRMAKELGATALKICSDSNLMVSQITDKYQTKDATLIKYVAKVKESLASLSSYEIQHVPREQNTRADLLSKLASTKPTGSSRSVIEEVIHSPCVVLHLDPADWRNPIRDYISTGKLPNDPTEARKIVRKASNFCLVEGHLFRRSISMPLLKCIGPSEVWYILAEIHEGSCGHHPGGKSLVRKALRAGYYWPSMMKDAKEHVLKCEACQLHGTFTHVPAQELHSFSAPWPFHTWGIDLLGPFHIAPGQLKFLIVAVDYFTKWIEAEPTATITSVRIQNFVFRSLICRFGIPAEIVSDNGTQFTDKGFGELLSGLRIKHRFASVEHPQSNGQAEAANKVIVSGLRKRCEKAKSNWVENLYQVLWGHRTTPHSSTGETPFKLAFGTDAVIPVEIENPTLRVTHPSRDNSQLIREDLDLLEEVHEAAKLADLARKQHIAQRYNSKVQVKEFQEGDLVLRRASIGNKNARNGKLAANWEGPYRVKRAAEKGAYSLEHLSGVQIPRTFNAVDLKRWFS